VFGAEIEYYCGHCGRQLEGKTGKCPHCGAPLSVTLVTVSKSEGEWINPDRWVIGRKGWIQGKWLSRWFPKYEEWLYNTKHRSLGELSSDEIKQTTEEYKKFLEERTKQANSWKIAKAEAGEPEEKVEKMSNEEFKKLFIEKLESLDKNIKQLADSLARIEVPKKPYPCPECGSTNVFYDAGKEESKCLNCKHIWKARP